MKTKVPYLMLLMMLIISQVSFSGEIAPKLLESIKNLDDAQKVPVIISLASNEKPSALKADLQASFAKLADRHRVGMERLKSTASLSQNDLLGYL